MLIDAANLLFSLPLLLSSLAFALQSCTLKIVCCFVSSFIIIFPNPNLENGDWVDFILLLGLVCTTLAKLFYAQVINDLYSITSWKKYV